jgi:uncharacterized protein (TIGR03435 family)
MLSMRSATIILGLVFGIAAAGQVRRAFEVASVKQAPPSARNAGKSCQPSFRVDGGRVAIQCATLTMLIGYAYRFTPYRITRPAAMATGPAARFDILATLPPGAVKHDVPELLQTLLAERFQLVVHHGQAEQPVYALVVSKGGLRLPPASGEIQYSDEPDGTITLVAGIPSRTTEERVAAGTDTTTLSNARIGTVLVTNKPGGIQHFDAPNTTMQGLADLLDGYVSLSEPIVDQTGVTGRYHVAFEVSLRLDAPRSDGPVDLEAAALVAFNDGLKPLGLRLERRKGTVEILVVDQVSTTPTEN